MVMTQSPKTGKNRFGPPNTAAGTTAEEILCSTCYWITPPVTTSIMPSLSPHWSGLLHLFYWNFCTSDIVNHQEVTHRQEKVTKIRHMEPWKCRTQSPPESSWPPPTIDHNLKRSSTAWATLALQHKFSHVSCLSGQVLGVDFPFGGPIPSFAFIRYIELSSCFDFSLLYLYCSDTGEGKLDLITLVTTPNWLHQHWCRHELDFHL